MIDLELSSEKPVLVDFYAPWCAPCQWLEPILEQVDKELKGHASILKINIDEYPAIAEKFNIQSVPTLMIFKNKEMQWRMNGFTLAPELVDIVKKYL